MDANVSLAAALRAGPLGARRVVGSFLGPYEVVAELGRGAFGVVLRARRRDRPGLDVALKVLHEGAGQRRFQREAQLGQALRHPGIVAVLDAGEQDGLSFIAFELVEGGRTLDQAARASLERATDLLVQVARAVGHAHAHGVVHRDLKPGNVLVRADGRALVADFGLARDTNLGSSLTLSGTSLGTPLYMSPEQVVGQGEPAPTMDVFALGVMLYEALTGEPPFPTDNVAVRYAAVEAQQVTPPGRRRPGLPAALDAVCLRALRARPDERHADAGAFAEALEAALVAPPPARLGPGPVALVVVAGALLLAALVVVRPWGAARVALDPPAALDSIAATGTGSPGGQAPAADAPAARAATAVAGPPSPLPAGLRAGDRPGEFVNERDGSVLVWVPPGAFRPGWLRGRRPPGHEVRLARGYFIGKYELGWAEWQRYVDAGHAADRDQKPLAGHPASRVSWDDAVAYCAWAGLRLPSDAEWEYAAHADTGSAQPWGDEPCGPERANVGPAEKPEGAADGYAGTSPRGAYPAGASPFGCLDMAGNVWEWVQDGWQRTYAGPPPDGSAWPTADGGVRCARGGSYYLKASGTFAVDREGFEPSRRRGNLGLRVAR